MMTLKEVILESDGYEEELVKERKRKEEWEIQEKKRKEELEIQERKRKEELEFQERKQKEEFEGRRRRESFELKKLKLKVQIRSAQEPQMGGARIPIMAGKNEIFNMKDYNDHETIKNMFLCDSEDDEDIGLDESDTDENEHISEREENSESE
ncbi:hypothetical protein NPIL_594451 [Nephila pilipes]|uniref:Uncharacterized protein n=1 Tax=Nephila pilipes TaxID=299642 RepID=A0A8X6MSR4_NEPPI|nr:hypothetical protein NPIL_594451 [Nephila pilipes]